MGRGIRETMDILGSVASILSGGATGLIGSIAQRVFEYKSKQLDIQLQKEKYTNEIALKQADAAIMAQEWAARTQVAQVEATAQVDAEDAKAFSASLTSEPQKYHEGALTAGQNWMMVALDFFRGSIRPSLTLYLCFITTCMYLKANRLIGSNMPINVACDLVQQIVQTVLYLTVTCVCFYFGVRNSKK